MKVTGDCIKIKLTNDGVIERQKLLLSVILYIFFRIIGISILVCLNSNELNVSKSTLKYHSFITTFTFQYPFSKLIIYKGVL